MDKISQKKPFIGSNFLLNSKEAERLYHDYAKNMPIIDYHNHLSARQIAENKPFGNLTEAWLSGDHYKWRALRANGIDETLITGTGSPEEKFLKWAETVPYTVRNPLFHWTQLELKRYFDIDAILQPSSAGEIYEKANVILKSKTPAQLLEDMNVEVVCTTDDIIDDLAYHRQIAEQKIFTKVFPTFRSDRLFLIREVDFLQYLNKLEASAHHKINDVNDLLQVLEDRVEYFDRNGCRLSDYGLAELFTLDYTPEEVDVILKKRMAGSEISLEEAGKYGAFIQYNLSKFFHAKQWAQQFHLGAIRNNNPRLLKQVGADSGCDSIGDISHAESMSRFFGRLEEEGILAKTITYNLNPAQSEVFATMMGNFSEAGVPGKMQWGSAWWFLDQKGGMENQLNILSNMGLLSRFIGMLTDSRSFLSFPRHEYFRRILCNLLAEDMNRGLVPDDMDFIGSMVQDICYRNAKTYFDFK